MKRQSAFTLVELLVALAISSIIFTSAYQVLSNLVQYQSRQGQQAERERQARLLRRLFAGIVERGVHRDDLFQPVGRQTLFNGQPESLQLLSRAFSRNFDRPGYRVYRLSLRDGRLLVGHRRYSGDEQTLDFRETDSGLALSSLRFEYFDGEQWLARWRDERRLPRYIRMHARLEGGQELTDVRETAVR